MTVRKQELPCIIQIRLASILAQSVTLLCRVTLSVLKTEFQLTFARQKLLNLYISMVFILFLRRTGPRSSNSDSVENGLNSHGPDIHCDN